MGHSPPYYRRETFFSIADRSWGKRMMAEYCQSQCSTFYFGRRGHQLQRKTVTLILKCCENILEHFHEEPAVQREAPLGPPCSALRYHYFGHRSGKTKLLSNESVLWNLHTWPRSIYPHPSVALDRKKHNMWKHTTRNTRSLKHPLNINGGPSETKKSAY
ncbi:hypothetical protein DACRYDRAFT_93538 [Dacryopinax primogenitus]|uniref:Uncharacterized protein n=1 Tax=Dacryopinax primogenitus (strain DJM 731) TaxID=1858805 RepID=M5G7E5_DACPD|nr:uncharacterized protein DACRYDRAFT_93538 [Dacryopinax primogenitus]EJU04110.1 hypothetical protein DACRYDRAFT_93538 [Dacryopinax primogenitus]